MEFQTGEERIKVLHVTGSGRSGSTLLTNTLGSVPGVFAAGEVRFLWERAVLGHEACGCGLDARACPIWKPILDELGRDAGSAGAGEVDRGLRQLIRLRRSGRFFVRRRPLDDCEQLVADRITAVYRAIAATTGCQLIVDSSKHPCYAAILDDQPDLDLYVLHLVRDPRAAAYSWNQGRSTTSAERMDQLSPVKSSVLWTVWNGATARRWGRQPRYLRLRYEDVMAAPRASLERIAEFAGIDTGQLPFVSDSEVVLSDGHVLAGNPNRRTTGPVQFRLDRRWKDGLRARDRWTVTTVTAPLLGRMGYPLRTS